MAGNRAYLIKCELKVHVIVSLGTLYTVVSESFLQKGHAFIQLENVLGGKTIFLLYIELSNSYDWPKAYSEFSKSAPVTS